MLLVGEDQQFAGLFEVDLGGEIGDGCDTGVLVGRHVGERRRQHGAADAIADGRHLFFAGGFLDGIEGGEYASCHIIVEALVGIGFVRVDPGNNEDRVTLVDRPADEGIVLAKIEDVKLVDPGRHDH